MTLDRTTLHTKWHGYEIPLAKTDTPITTPVHSTVDILHSHSEAPKQLTAAVHQDTIASISLS
jgi:hypothetical protein